MGTKFNEYIRTLGSASPKAKELILYRAAHDPEVSLFDLTVLVSRAYPNGHTDSPAADVEPVRHGRWKDGYCTHCGSPCLCNGIEEDVLSPYCPDCGAKMDLEEVAK